MYGAKEIESRKRLIGKLPCVYLYFVLQIWGDDVEAFRPDRWLDENGELRSIPEFIPFGLGMLPPESFHKLKLVECPNLWVFFL